MKKPTPQLVAAFRAPAAIALVAAIYVHFLLFAQFGFLQGIRAVGHDAGTIHRVLGVMALCGIAASLGAVFILWRQLPGPTAAVGFALCAAGAVAAGWIFRQPSSDGSGALVWIAAATGAGLGLATVAAAPLLRRLGGPSLALQVGAGTGLAYLLCNIPAVFEASPTAKSWISALAASVGACAALCEKQRAQYPCSEHEAWSSLKATGAAALGFLALVWFDSAAFAALQNAQAAREVFWSGAPTLWAIGISHATAALVAGWLVDRGALRLPLAAAWLLLAAGHVGFTSEAVPAANLWAAPLYAAGVSLYSTALAAFAALSPPVGWLSPAVRAASIYSLAGWLGSAAGVGLAERFGSVPGWAAPLAATLLLGSLAALPRSR